MNYTVYSAWDDKREKPLGTVEVDEGGIVTSVDNYGESVSMELFAERAEGLPLRRTQASFRKLFFVES